MRVGCAPACAVGRARTALPPKRAVDSRVAARNALPSRTTNMGKHAPIEHLVAYAGTNLPADSVITSTWPRRAASSRQTHTT
eukprot:3802065-Alexandrium_andersonii.AAC.1